jgi:hypothetical protein
MHGWQAPVAPGAAAMSGKANITIAGNTSVASAIRGLYRSIILFQFF